MKISRRMVCGAWPDGRLRWRRGTTTFARAWAATHAGARPPRRSSVRQAGVMPPEAAKGVRHRLDGHWAGMTTLSSSKQALAALGWQAMQLARDFMLLRENTAGGMP